MSEQEKKADDSFDPRLATLAMNLRVTTLEVQLLQLAQNVERLTEQVHTIALRMVGQR